MDASGLDRLAGGVHMKLEHCRRLAEATVLVLRTSVESCRQLVGSSE